MKIYAKTLTGKCVTLDKVGGHRTVYEIKVLLSDAIEMPAKDQRIVFNGEELQDDNATLNDFDIVSESIIHIVFRARCMISTFTSKSTTTSCCSTNDTSSSSLATSSSALSHNDKLLIQYLMGKTRRVPYESLQVKAKEEYADKKATFSYNSTGTSILSKEQRKRLVDFMDFMWDNVTTAAADNTANSNNIMSSHSDYDQQVVRVDMRLALSDQQFLDLLGSLEEEEVEQQSDLDTRPKHVLGRLNKAFHSVPRAFGTDRPKIALRQTRGPTKACINFHCDGPYASSTTQIALNEEYKGGTLIFFCNGKLHRLDNRPAGSLVQHPPKVLHGVTCLTSGIRNSLFVVDQQNGLGEAGVIVVTSEHVRSFLGSKDTSVAAASMVAVKG
jgi:hypothetical protein